jgi:hypothetical protein
MFTFYADPGHGWLKVPRPLLKDLGIAGQISRFSYQNSGAVYLEEDCDAGLFKDAWEARNGGSIHDYVTTETTDRESPIRQFACYRTI